MDPRAAYYAHRRGPSVKHGGQSLRVIRFQSGPAARSPSFCSAVETVTADTRTDHLLCRVSLAWEPAELGRF